MVRKSQWYRFLLKLSNLTYSCCQQRNLHPGIAFFCKPSQNSGNDSVLPTMSELRRKFEKTRGITSGFMREIADRSYLLKYLPESQEELPPRSVKDSSLSAIIPLSSDPQLEEKYLNILGRVRFGRLMEDMDMFSDFVTISYIKNPKQPEDEILAYEVVTVLVDHMEFTGYIPRGGLDLRVSGHVSSVGKTSVETTVRIEQNDHGTYHEIMKAFFLMAARNAINSGGAYVNPLVPADDEEKRIVAEGEARRRQRLTREKASTLTAKPNPEEQEIIHRLFVESTDTTLARRVLPPDSAWLTDTKRTNNIFSFTEDRNFHNTVFGGFLMRHALEMAWFTGYFYCRHRPTLRCVSDIHFKHSVPLGSVISFHGQVVYTEGELMQIFVHGDVNDPVRAESITSVMFHYTYESPEPIKRVKPNTYYEAMMYVDGRRHFMELMNRRKEKES